MFELKEINKTVRLSPSQYKEIEKKAAKKGIKSSTFMREASINAK